MKEINNYQQDLGTTLERRASSYFLNVAKHAIPIIGAIWVTNNINYAYPTSVKDNVVMPTLEETVLVQELIGEKRQQVQLPTVKLPTLQELVQINPLIEGKYQATSKYAAAIESAEKKHGIPTGLYAGLIMRESGGSPRAVSRVGAAGLSQLMPATAKELGAKVLYGSGNLLVKSTGYGDSLSALVDRHKSIKELANQDERFNPEKNIRWGARYLKQLYNQLGDWNKALAAYEVGVNSKHVHKRSRYYKAVREYQEYWNGRNRRLPEFAYTSGDTVATKL